MNNILTFGQKEATNRPEEIKITSGINKTSPSFTYHVLSIKKFRMIRESISTPKKISKALDRDSHVYVNLTKFIQPFFL